MIANLLNYFRKRAVRNRFTEIYKKNLFGGKESISGEGSSLAQTEVVRKELPLLLRTLKLKTMIDAPCGDIFWMKEVDLPVEKYIGIDIVEEIIEDNKERYVVPGRVFISKNIITDELPEADLILCRDCLVHLSFDHAIAAIKNFKNSGAKYLLTTTFTDRGGNEDLGKAVWRTLNLEKAPFDFPKPLKLINEGCTEGDGNFADKALALWALKDINLSGN